MKIGKNINIPTNLWGIINHNGTSMKQMIKFWEVKCVMDCKLQSVDYEVMSACFKYQYIILTHEYLQPLSSIRMLSIELHVILNEE